LEPTEPPVATAGYAALSRPTPLDLVIGIVLVAVTGAII
jgi:hypothetical protein